ncbi:MAG TPA: arsenate reductase [Stellaceae bacterium]|nr:arsenate reductase [Stellaceae bacterium]
MTVRIYGIKNCDTMQNAFKWLGARGVAYDFHDYKKAAVTAAELTRWCNAVGWQTVLNRAGTTFRKLPDAAKGDLTPDKAIALMVAQPSMIKRPVLDVDGKLEIGFKPERYTALFGLGATAQ